MTRGGLLALAIAAGALAAIPSSASAGAWLGSVPLNGSGSGSQVATDASGDVVAAWQGPGDVVQASIRRAGESFTAPATLTPSGTTATSVDLDVNEAGNGVLAWSTPAVVQFVDVSPAGFGAVQTVPTALAGPRPGEVSLAIDGTGTTTFAWTFSAPRGARIRLARRPAGGPVTVTRPTSGETEEAATPSVAVNAAGLATAAWSADRLDSSGDAVGSVIESVTWPPGGVLSATEMARPATDDQVTLSDASVGVDATGAAIVAWMATEFGFTDDRGIVQTAVRSPQGVHGSVLDLSGAAENATALALDVNEAGTAILPYAVSPVSGGTDAIRVAARSAGGQFAGPGQTIASGPATEDLSQPAAAVNRAGTAFVAWSRGNKISKASAVQAAVGPAGALGAPTELSPAGSKSGAPALTADGEGNAFAAWENGGPLGATAFDGAPPQLRGLNVPAEAVAQEPASFSVAPFDTWSAVSTAWTFGDGTGAAGDAVSHGYASPGPYSVGVTATDAVGNAASDSRPITVTPRGTAPPPQASRAGLSLTNVAGNRYCLASAGRRIDGAAEDLVIRFTLNDPATMTFRLQKRSAPPAKPRRRCPTRGGKPGASAVQFGDLQTATLPASAGETFVDVKALRANGRKARGARSRPTTTRVLRLDAGRARARLAQLFGAAPLTPGWYRILLQGRRENDGSLSQTVSVKFLVLAASR